MKTIFEGIEIKWNDITQRFGMGVALIRGEGADGKIYEAYGVLLGSEIVDLDSEPTIEEVI